MALTSQGFWLEVVFADNGGNQTARTYQMSSPDYDTAIAEAATMLGYIGNVTNAAIAAYYLSERFVETALSLPGSGVQVEDTALVNLRLETGLKTATVSIPAPKATIFAASTEEGADTVDPLDADLGFFVNEFKSRANGGSLYISDGENIKNTAPIIGGRRVHRRSHRRRSVRIG